jgi:beta-galactosidase
VRKPILFAVFILILAVLGYPIQVEASPSPRERIRLADGWRFSLGHATDASKDFNHGTAYFSYLTKAGNGDGPAAEHFDDRAWRVVSVPHDWAVELPFSEKGGHSHGYRAIGRNFPENSVGWYRRSFHIPESDRGRRIRIEFDGVHRGAVVWVNGFYMGVESTGTIGFGYDVTDHLNYGGDNVVALRVDATLEEGWYYEGAGIYRHAWLVKTDPLHVTTDGVAIVAHPQGPSAQVVMRTEVERKTGPPAGFEVRQEVLDAEGHVVARGSGRVKSLSAGSRREVEVAVKIRRAQRWTLEDPYLYRVITTLLSKGRVVDRVEDTFGVRSIHFDPDRGFFLNGERIQLQGTNNHQDHAGVGAAVPDALQEFRIRRLKEMGCNAYRSSHQPPTKELLDVCDRMGMLVIDENRLMGTAPELMDRLERLIRRDRNRPSVILWSLGNEEWTIEGTERGAQIAQAMQDFVLRLDPTRRVTKAVSGGCGHGISTVIDVMGYNYLRQCDIDAHHAKFPLQPGVGTEETTTFATRGIYEDIPDKCHTMPSNYKGGPDIEVGMKFYDARPFLAGHFLWTGFDHGGEPNPFHYPAVHSQKGPIDICGFPKDTFHYLRAWWTKEEVLHLGVHWNWEGRKGREIPVRAYGNCEEVELFLNGRSLGRKPMPRLSHIQWNVSYEAGKLEARGFRGGRQVSTASVETTGKPASITLSADRTQIRADGRDLSVVTVAATDAKGRAHPTAGDEIIFEVEGPGRIIGVGNGDPSSHEKDRVFDLYRSIEIRDTKMLRVDRWDASKETAFAYDDSSWGPAFAKPPKWDGSILDAAMTVVVRGTFDLGQIPDGAEYTL